MTYAVIPVVSESNSRRVGVFSLYHNFSFKGDVIAYVIDVLKEILWSFGLQSLPKDLVRIKYT